MVSQRALAARSAKRWLVLLLAERRPQLLFHVHQRALRLVDRDRGEGCKDIKR